MELAGGLRPHDAVLLTAQDEGGAGDAFQILFDIEGEDGTAVGKEPVIAAGPSHGPQQGIHLPVFLQPLRGVAVLRSVDHQLPVIASAGVFHPTGDAVFHQIVRPGRRHRQDQLLHPLRTGRRQTLGDHAPLGDSQHGARPDAHGVQDLPLILRHVPDGVAFRHVVYAAEHGDGEVFQDGKVRLCQQQGLALYGGQSVRQSRKHDEVPVPATEGGVFHLRRSRGNAAAADVSCHGCSSFRSTRRSLFPPRPSSSGCRRCSGRRYIPCV